ncbi:MBL fold metallo-hydrolase [Spirosoma validum]|uniref:MBL fold metallo-hydrolase n=1 Tax=Spirosoma validum TaxID=2771355 RepID=A0A927B0M3_9BACT|nr:MBL fold metallo-hydrolase [Spirosoma validum]MBD2753238.1 MBL fold metallo-hydrolase [Spirosoma validum]
MNTTNATSEDLSVNQTTDKTICATCGTQYPANKPLPELCPICNNDRQYIGDDGQVWTSLATLAKDRTIRFSQVHENLYDLRITPAFAIGQRAFLILSESGNVLWDCLPFLDEPTVAFIQSKGGLNAIAISHPHYYSLMAEWARIFNCPIYIHQHDAEWVQKPSGHVQFWTGNQKALWDGMTIINTGGHFPGSCVLYLPDKSGKDSILTGDSIYVARDRRAVTFMYSYPNLIPLSKKDIEQIRDRMADVPFDRIYGAFDGMIIAENGRAVFDASIQRYLKIVS